MPIFYGPPSKADTSAYSDSNPLRFSMSRAVMEGIVIGCFFSPLKSQEHFYDPASHSGFLEMRLRNIRRKLEEGQRRYSRHKRGRDVGPNSVQDEGDGSEVREFINLMKRLRPSADNMPSIKSAMQKTFTWRRSWISKHSPTMEEIFQEYPRFLDIPTLVGVLLYPFHKVCIQYT